MSLHSRSLIERLSSYRLPGKLTASARRKRVRSGRIWVLLLFDSSPSTGVNGAAAEIERGGRSLAEHIKSDSYLAGRVDLSVFGLGVEEVCACYADSVPAEQFEMPKIPGVFSTPLYGAYAEVVADAIESRHEFQQEFDCDIESTLVFVFSDFIATDPEARQQALEAKAAASEAGLNLFMLGAGQEVEESVISELSQPSRPPVMLADENDFARFFDWLKQSLSIKSRSVGGQPLMLEDLTGKPTRLEG